MVKDLNRWFSRQMTNDHMKILLNVVSHQEMKNENQNHKETPIYTRVATIKKK